MGESIVARSGLHVPEQDREQTRRLRLLLGGRPVDRLRFASRHPIDRRLDQRMPRLGRFDLDRAGPTGSGPPDDQALALGPGDPLRDGARRDQRAPAQFARAQGVPVDNAGGNTDFDHGPAADLAGYARAFRADPDANLVGAALTTRAVEDRLAAGGAVIGIGSIAADTGAGSYGAAKAGPAAWNVALADALGPRDITADVVSPGYIADTEFFRDNLPPDRRRDLVAATSVRRAGSPEDVVGAVASLASPAARHVTGQVLNVNGGADRSR